MPPGDYLLVVSRGPSTTDTDRFDLTIGAVGPQGPKGDTGDKGEKGDKGDPGQIPDTSDFARLAAPNTFTAANTFNSPVTFNALASATRGIFSTSNLGLAVTGVSTPEMPVPGCRAKASQAALG